MLSHFGRLPLIVGGIFVLRAAFWIAGRRVARARR